MENDTAFQAVAVGGRPDVHSRGRLDGEAGGTPLRPTLPDMEKAFRLNAETPGYAPSPMHRLPAAAAMLQVGSLYVKDETARFGLGSFKALGGGYAVRELNEVEPVGRPFATASAGNHGLAVAWASRSVGRRAIIYLPTGVAAARVRAIQDQAAEIVHIEGGYDDAVRRLAQDAEANGWMVVADTSQDENNSTTLAVMSGYATLVLELNQQLGSSQRPTHIWVQAGVGGLAAAVCSAAHRLWGQVNVVVVEPSSAASILASIRAGAFRRFDNPPATTMSPLACMQPSAPALKILSRLAAAFVAIDDDWAAHAQQMLRGIRVKTSTAGAAGLGALLAVLSNDHYRKQLELGSEARVLVIATEAGTDV